MRTKIYVGCSLTQAPEEFKQEVERFKEKLAELPGVEVLQFIGLVNGTSRDVYQTDLGNVERSDLFVAICDYPSIGLGMELQHARFFKRPTLALYQERLRVTRMLYGAEELGYLACRKYRSLSEDGLDAVKECLAREAQAAAAD